MGLDQYAYVATRANQNSDWWDGAEVDTETKEYINPNIEKPREIAYWRKHPNLHGWMNQLWLKKGANMRPSDDPTFNGVELELTWEDLDELEHAVEHKQLPSTTGFFFGEDSDDYYRKQDLEFIKTARSELFCGLRVFYNSSW